uniref:Uncharacterized protein n=1 Tax=Schistosoma mansoni TaxID=6183 RepID=A0A5K4F815_SCHMA
MLNDYPRQVVIDKRALLLFAGICVLLFVFHSITVNFYFNSNKLMYIQITKHHVQEIHLSFLIKLNSFFPHTLTYFFP